VERRERRGRQVKLMRISINFSSRTHFTCPRAPLLVSRSRGRYVGSRSHYDHGEEGDLVELVSACKIAISVSLDARHIKWTSH